MDLTFTKISTGPGAPKPGIDNAMSPTWWDDNNDGFPDLFIANGAMFGQALNLFYQNNGDGTFTRITNVTTTTAANYCAAAPADYDNDGDDDLLVSRTSGAPVLYRNDGGGAFTALTQQQLGPSLGDAEQTLEASWVDYDRDGFLDLFRASGILAAANDGLYRNNGDGTFTRMSQEQVGEIVADHGATWASAWADYDNDGWPDLWVENESGPNLLYQ